MPEFFEEYLRSLSDVEALRLLDYLRYDSEDFAQEVEDILAEENPNA